MSKKQLNFTIDDLDLLRKEQKRIRRSGYRAKLPEGTKLVAKPSKWHNKYPLSKYSRHASLSLYEQDLRAVIELNHAALDALIGYDLACYCTYDKECHVNVLLKYLQVRKEFLIKKVLHACCYCDNYGPNYSYGKNEWEDDMWECALKANLLKEFFFTVDEPNNCKSFNITFVWP